MTEKKTPPAPGEPPDNSVPPQPVDKPTTTSGLEATLRGLNETVKHGPAQPSSSELEARSLAQRKNALPAAKIELREFKQALNGGPYNRYTEDTQKFAWDVEWTLHQLRDELSRGDDRPEDDETLLYLEERLAHGYKGLVHALLKERLEQEAIPEGLHTGVIKVFADIMLAVPSRTRLLLQLMEDRPAIAEDKPQLPAIAPEFFHDRPDDPATGKRETIGQFLKRVWWDPWISAGLLTRADFRRLDPKGEMALRNAIRRADHGLPPELHLLTRSERVSRELEQRTPDEIRDARRLLKTLYRRTAKSDPGKP